MLTSFLTVSSLDARDNAAFETQVEAIAEESDQLLKLNIEYRADLFSQQPTAVTIHVADSSPPEATTIRERIRTETGTDIEVTVLAERADIDRS